MNRAWTSLITQTGPDKSLSERQTFPILKKAGPFVYNLEPTYFPKRSMPLKDTHLLSVNTGKFKVKKDSMKKKQGNSSSENKGRRGCGM